MLVLKEMASYMHLGDIVIIFGAFQIGWFAALSMMRTGRVLEITLSLFPLIAK